MSINVQSINAVNKGLDLAESAIAAVREAYNTACDPQWQQVQFRRIELGATLLASYATMTKGQINNIVAHVQVAKAEANAYFWSIKKKVHSWFKSLTPYGLKMTEGVVIILCWLAIGEEFAFSCWQAYVNYVGEYIESCIEENEDLRQGFSCGNENDFHKLFESSLEAGWDRLSKLAEWISPILFFYRKFLGFYNPRLAAVLLNKCLGGEAGKHNGNVSRK